MQNAVFQVLNGLAADAPRLQRFCGTVPAGTQVHSSGNTMAVVFHTDASVTNGGFSATYSSEESAGERLEKRQKSSELRHSAASASVITLNVDMDTNYSPHL